MIETVCDRCVSEEQSYLGVENEIHSRSLSNSYGDNMACYLVFCKTAYYLWVVFCYQRKLRVRHSHVIDLLKISKFAVMETNIFHNVRNNILTTKHIKVDMTEISKYVILNKFETYYRT